MFTNNLTLALLSAIATAVQLNEYSDDMFLGMECGTASGCYSRDSAFDEASARTRVSTREDFRSSLADSQPIDTTTRRDFFVETPDEIFIAPIYVGMTDHDDEHHPS